MAEGMNHSIVWANVKEGLTFIASPIIIFCIEVMAASGADEVI